MPVISELVLEITTSGVSRTETNTKAFRCLEFKRNNYVLALTYGYVGICKKDLVSGVIGEKALRMSVSSLISIPHMCTDCEGYPYNSILSSRSI